MCLTPGGTGRLYDNQLHCNLHLILFYKKNELYKKKRESRGETEKLKTVWGKCRTGRKANRSFFSLFFFFLSSESSINSWWPIKHAAKIFGCTFNLKGVLNLLLFQTYSSSRSDRVANNSVHFEMSYFLLSSQKILLQPPAVPM